MPRWGPQPSGLHCGWRSGGGHEKKGGKGNTTKPQHLRGVINREEGIHPVQRTRNQCWQTGMSMMRDWLYAGPGRADVGSKGDNPTQVCQSYAKSASHCNRNLCSWTVGPELTSAVRVGQDSGILNQTRTWCSKTLVPNDGLSSCQYIPSRWGEQVIKRQLRKEKQQEETLGNHYTWLFLGEAYKDPECKWTVGSGVFTFLLNLLL